MTEDLLALSDWLAVAGCTHVVLESTGVYWKPVWNVLEGSFELLLVNAQHVKQVPGRKTDVKDAEWLAELLRHGLVRGSFVPDQPQRELRELTRYRTAKVRERTREVQRLQKTLEGANIKLTSVATDVTGKSARAMLNVLVADQAGTADPAGVSDLAEGRLREASLALYNALVLRLDARGAVRFDPAKTPGDYRREVRANPAVARPFAAFVRGFEPVVFGGRALDPDGYERLRAAAGEAGVRG
jgi:hypothetical protein